MYLMLVFDSILLLVFVLIESLLCNVAIGQTRSPYALGWRREVVQLATGSHLLISLAVHLLD